MLGVFKKKLKSKRPSIRSNNLQSIAPSSYNDNVASSSKKPLEFDEKDSNNDLSENTCYPLTPNICVEGGRIEFIKISQTDIQNENYEEKIRQLEKLLTEEKHKTECEKTAYIKLQTHNAKLETHIQNLLQEKIQTEELNIKSEENMKCTLFKLQNDCRRLEESVRCLLPYKTQLEQIKNEKIAATITYENKVQELELQTSSLVSDNEFLKQRIKDLELKEVGYEACLDQVASQVVKALLSQKGLKEEIISLRSRIRDLEQQNISLTSLICCQHHQNKTTVENIEKCPGVHRPKSLNLIRERDQEDRSLEEDDEEASISHNQSTSKDEGYNTLTSEIPPDNNTDILKILPDLTEENENNLFEYNKKFNQNIRHSFPPLTNTKIKFQNLLNYFSESQLYLKLNNNNNNNGGVGCKRSNQSSNYIRFSDFWDYETGFLDSYYNGIYAGASESLWNIEDILKFDRPLSLTPSITPSNSSRCSSSRSSSAESDDLIVQHESNVEFTSDYYCLVKVGSVKSLSSSPQQLDTINNEECNNDKIKDDSMIPLLKDQDDNISSTTNTSMQEEDEEEKSLIEDDLEKLLENISICNDDTSSPLLLSSDSSLSDVDLNFLQDYEYLQLSDDKDKRYNSMPIRRKQINNNSNFLIDKLKLDRCKSESQLNKTIKSSYPNIHKSYYNNFVKFSSVNNLKQRNSISSDDLQFDEEKDEKLLLNVENQQEKDTTMCASSSPCNNDENNLIISDTNELLINDTNDSKTIIETLNRMIQKSSTTNSNSSEEQLNRNSGIELKSEGVPTSWVHFEQQTNFNDPKERANLLDRMLSGVPSSEESEDDYKDYQHLLKLHRRRRHRKAYMHHAGFLRNNPTCMSRTSIVNQKGFYTRYGEAEKQAVASFDFLYEVDDDLEDDTNV